MFFRFYILSILSCLVMLFTPLWGVSYVILFWILIILIRMHFYYKKWKKQQARHYSKTLSFCIKSMNRQKQNFRIINRLLKNEILKNFFKRASILFDDINVKVTSKHVEDLPKTTDHLNKHVHSPVYSHLSSNIYHD
jgi:predicted tellurium resistance membrane protein TerC